MNRLTVHPSWTESGSTVLAHTDPGCTFAEHGTALPDGIDAAAVAEPCRYCHEHRPDRMNPGRPPMLARAAVEHAARGMTDDGRRQGPRHGRDEPGVEHAAPRRTNPSAPPARPNRYAGSCTICHEHVPAGDGTLTGAPGAWTVTHAPDTCTAPPTPPPTAPIPQPAPTAAPSPSTQHEPVPPGYYCLATTSPDATNAHAFYRVDHGRDGRVYVVHVIGGHADRNVARAAAGPILARIADDPDAAARYGQLIGRCYRCNRTLTNDRTRAAGIGDDCAAKGL